MTPAQKTAWTLIVLTPLAIGIGLLLLSLNRSTQFVVFSNSIEQIDFTTPVDTWSLPAAGIVALQVTQCELGVGAGSVKPQPGSSMRVDLAHSLNLQINAGGKLDVTVAAPTIAHDVGLTWTLKSPRASTFTVVLFADSVTIVSPDNQVWRGPQLTTPQSASNGLEFSCQTSRKDGASIALVATAKQPLLELGPQMPVEHPRLRAPRGQIAVGNTLLPLGAGELKIDGRMTLKPFRWTPSTPTVFEASVSGRSANVTMDDDQLVPSTLAGFSQHPGWTAFAGVCAVVLGAFFSKLFDHAMT